MQESLGNYWIIRSKSLAGDHPAGIVFKNKAFYHYDKAIGLLNDSDKHQARERISGFAGMHE
jgi:hypothetical protein